MDWNEATLRLLDLRASGYDTIASLTDVSLGDEADAQLRTASGGTSRLRIASHGSRIVRLRFSRHAADPRPSPVLVDPLPPSAGADWAVDHRNITLSTSHLHLVVDRARFAISLSLPGIGTIWETESNDRKAFNAGFASPPTGLVEDELGRRVVVNWKLHPDESIYGLGERFGPLDQRGRRVACFNRGSGTWTEGTHKTIPFLLSTAGYGLFITPPGPRCSTWVIVPTAPAPRPLPTTNSICFLSPARRSRTFSKPTPI